MEGENKMKIIEQFLDAVSEYACTLADNLNLEVIIQTNDNSVEQTTLNISVLHPKEED